MATRKKKLNPTLLSFRDPGPHTGIIGEITQMVKDDGSPVLSRAYGTELFTIELSDPKSGEVKKYWVDAGLRGTLKSSKNVVPGMFVEIVHTGEKKIETTDADGEVIKATVQTYDIYECE